MAKKNYWLMKSEPDVYSIDQLKKDKKTYWDGVRNYQARNIMRDKMEVGDGVLYYHSNCNPPAIVGLARVCSGPYPDPTQFDKRSKYFDEKSTRDNPRWQLVDVEFVEKFSSPLALGDLRENSDLEGMALLRKGQRLSVQPVTEREWKIICKLANAKEG